MIKISWGIMISLYSYESFSQEMRILWYNRSRSYAEFSRIEVDDFFLFKCNRHDKVRSVLISCSLIFILFSIEKWKEDHANCIISKFRPSIWHPQLQSRKNGLESCVNTLTCTFGAKFYFLDYLFILTNFKSKILFPSIWCL